MKYPRHEDFRYFDASAMYGFELNGVQKLCMLWGQGAPSEIGDCFCGYMRQTSREDLYHTASKLKVYDSYAKVGSEADYLKEYGFTGGWHEMSLNTWDDVMRYNGYLLGSIDRGYPITCDCTKYLMASDWAYTIQIATHQGERQSTRKRERETSYAGATPQIDIRFAVYRKVSCNERLYQSPEKPYIGQQEADLPPVFVSKTFESSRYPNHVMIVSYDYACLPQILSSDMLKLEKA